MKKVEKMKRVVQHFGVAAALFSGVLFPAAACAEPISQEDYETKTVDAYLFDKDHKTSVELVFKKDLPEIPYIDASDFLNPFLFPCPKSVIITITVQRWGHFCANTT